MAALDDLGSPELSVLLRMAKHGETMHHRQFSVAAQVSPASAIRVRQRLEELGLIKVSLARRQGPAEVLDIVLTPLGRRVAEQFLAASDLMDRARKR